MAKKQAWRRFLRIDFFKKSLLLKKTCVLPCDVLVMFCRFYKDCRDFHESNFQNKSSKRKTRSPAHLGLCITNIR